MIQTYITCLLLIINHKWNENLPIYQIVLKYYEHDCLENLFSFFLSLVTTSFVKKSQFLTGIYFISLRKHRILNLKGFQYQIWSSVKRSGKYLLSQILALFWILFTLILTWNCVKGLRNTKIFKQMKFEGGWCEFNQKAGCRDVRKIFIHFLCSYKQL